MWNRWAVPQKLHIHVPSQAKWSKECQVCVVCSMYIGLMPSKCVYWHSHHCFPVWNVRRILLYHGAVGQLCTNSTASGGERNCVSVGMRGRR